MPMTAHDKERLDNIYPDGVPETVLSMMERIQKLRHSHIQTGHLSGDTLALLCVVAERFPTEVPALGAVIASQATEEKKENPLDALDEVEDPKPEPKPISTKPVNWFAQKKGTAVICQTDKGQVRGHLAGVFKTGDDKGKLKIKLPDSDLEFDVFHKNRVSIDPDQSTAE